MLLHPAVSRKRRTVLARALSMLLGGALVAGLVSVASFVAPTDRAQAAGLDGTFDPGYIISDADMFDFTRMTADDIQRFLVEKTPFCDPAATAPCLKDYRVDTHSIAAVPNRCVGDIVGAAAQSAAEIIATVARACEVNPQALIVTLQKEQGLVTSTSPTEGKYRIAMGYGCPDTAPCDADYFGFFNQVYQAAYAFQKYTKSPDQYTAYQPGVHEIKINPKSECGTQTVTIRNAATAALYFYTPYVPNAAALANLTGLGDACSSYGNRNFWVYFNSWFSGSAAVAPYFVKNEDTKQIYLIIDGKRRPVEDKREMRLLSRYAGIRYALPSLDGSLVAQIGRGGVAVLLPGSVVKSSKKSKTLWFIDGLSTRRPISAGQALELTGSSKASVVSKKTIAGYTTGKGAAKLGLFVNGKYFIGDNGVLRQISAVDAEAYRSRFGFGQYDASTLAALDRGKSIGRLIALHGQYYLVRSGTKVKISSAKYKQLAHQLGKKAQPVSDYFAARLPTRR